MNRLKNDALGSKLGRRLTALFVVCALIPLISLSWLTVTEITTRLEADARVATQRTSKSVGMRLMERLRFLQTDLRFAARELRGIEDNRLWSSPELELRFRSRFLGMVRCVGDLTIRSQGGQRLSIPTLSSTERRLLNSGAAVLVANTHQTGRSEVVMAALADPDDPTKGAFYAWPDPEYLWSGDDFSGDAYEMLICDEERRLLYATADSTLALTALGSAVSSRPTAGHFDWEGPQGAGYTAGYWQLFLRPQLGQNWMIIASRPRIDVLAPIAEFNKSFFHVALVTILLVFVLSLAQIRKTLRPITVLKEATRHVSSDDLDVRVEINSRDEFSELGKSFNDMLQRLQDSTNAQADLALALDAALASAETESEILTNVSHELRTPITSIRAFAEILHTHSADPETIAEFSGIILAESERISRLLENMLSLSRIHSGQLEVDRAEVDLGGSVASACTALRAAAHEQDIEIALATVGDPVVVLADRDQLAQVWVNLLANALKFSPAHSKIRVVVERDGNSGVVAIQDHGPGIPPADHALIFERFRQSTDNLTDKPSGTGLGLTIARDIIALHDGQIEVESEPPCGATFRVRIPLVQTVVDATTGQDHQTTGTAC